MNIHERREMILDYIREVGETTQLKIRNKLSLDRGSLTSDIEYFVRHKMIKKVERGNETLLTPYQENLGLSELYEQVLLPKRYRSRYGWMDKHSAHDGQRPTVAPRSSSSCYTIFE